MCAAQGLQYEVDVLATQGQGKLVQGKVRSHALATDQPEPFGGTDTAPNPPEAYAFALGACLVSALRLIASLENVDARNIQVRVRGTLAIGKEAYEKSGQAGFPGFDLDVSFDSSLSGNEKKAFVDRVVKMCPVCANTCQETPLRVAVVG